MRGDGRRPARKDAGVRSGRGSSQDSPCLSELATADSLPWLQFVIVHSTVAPRPHHGSNPDSSKLSFRTFFCAPFHKRTPSQQRHPTYGLTRPSAPQYQYQTFDRGSTVIMPGSGKEVPVIRRQSFGQIPQMPYRSFQGERDYIRTAYSG